MGDRLGRGGGRRGRATIVAGAVGATAAMLVPALAAPLTSPDPYPRVVVLARNDVPFDSLGAGAVAAQLGAPVVITPPTRLSDAAREAIVAADPSVLLVAGGVAAVSEEVATVAAAACTPACAIDRRGGADRDSTAAELASVLADYGIVGPAILGDGQVVGDLHVGGTVAADRFAVQSTDRVAGLNADRVDGRDAADLLAAAADASWPLVLQSRGQPRLRSGSATTTVNEYGSYVEFRADEFSSDPIVRRLYLDLPGPAAVGTTDVVLADIELCYGMYGTDSAFVEATVTAEGLEDSSVSWPIDLGYNIGSPDVQPCYSLGNPAIPATGILTLTLRWEESELTPFSVDLHGVRTTWVPAD